MVFPVKQAVEDILSKVKDVELIVAKRKSFDAAHYLPDYEGKCANLHGHRWTVELGVKGPVGEDGMVVDFTILNEFLGYIQKQFDHTLLNDVIGNPTAENILLYVKDRWGEFDKDLTSSGQTIALEFIRVWETEDSYAEWRQG